MRAQDAVQAILGLFLLLNIAVMGRASYLLWFKELSLNSELFAPCITEHCMCSGGCSKPCHCLTSASLRNSAPLGWDIVVIFLICCRRVNHQLFWKATGISHLGNVRFLQITHRKGFDYVCVFVCVCSQSIALLNTKHVWPAHLLHHHSKPIGQVTFKGLVDTLHTHHISSMVELRNWNGIILTPSVRLKLDVIEWSGQSFLHTRQLCVTEVL